MNPTFGVHGATGKLGKMILSSGNCVAIPKEGSIPHCDLIIDVSSAEGLTNLIPRLTKQPLLVGSTGQLPWTLLERYALHCQVAVVPNFSVGVPLLIEMVEQALRSLPPGWDIEVVEAHHRHKVDAPSGTAKRIVRAIQDCGVENVPTHALRVGDTFGEHSIWLCGPGERLELKHVATGREVFAIGALRWAKWLIDQPFGLIKP